MADTADPELPGRCDIKLPPGGGCSLPGADIVVFCGAVFGTRYVTYVVARDAAVRACPGSGLVVDTLWFVAICRGATVCVGVGSFVDFCTLAEVFVTTAELCS